MLTLAVDDFKDLYLDRVGNISMGSDVDALAATCSQVMSTLIGEMLFDSKKGVDYNGTVLSFGEDGIPAFVVSGTSALLLVQGVISVVYFYANARGRYVALLETTFGQFSVGNTGD